jgi:type VI secretion system protein ImpL
VNFVWPNQGAIPGARITVVDLEGKTHTIFEEPGEYGINRLIDAAQRKEQNGSFEMTWTSKAEPSFNLKVNFRLISGNSSGNIGSSRGYAGLQLVDKVVTDKAVRVVSAQAMPTNVAVTQPQTAPSPQLGVAP